MFGKFKEKLKGWFSSSAEKIVEEGTASEDTVGHDAEIIESEEEVVEETGEKEDEVKESVVEEVSEKDIEKVERLIEKANKNSGQEIPVKYNEIRKKTEPDLDNVREEAERIKKDVEIGKKNLREAKKQRKDIEKFEEELRKAKGEEVKEKESESETDNLVSEEKKTFFQRMKSGFSYKITEDEFDKIFDDLELLLLENNVALEAVDDIKESLKEKLIGKEIRRAELEDEIKKELRRAIEDVLIEPDNPLDFIKIADKPYKILFFGINGTGKTTSIAKIASYLKKAGFSVVLAAGDTFRAASIEQIGEHAKNIGVPLIKQDYGADPAAVGYDAIQYAKKHKIDVVLIDTAGRMHTKSNLLAEMEKIVRVTDPDLKLFVAESVAGNDAVEQAKAFHECVDIDGSILSKADIDEKGGTVISVSHATGKPVFYLGTGQNYEDFELFNKQKFVEGLGL